MPEVNNDPDPNSQEAQMKLLETLVGDLPAFKEAVDTGQGMLAPEGQEADAFYKSFTPQPPQPAAAQSGNGQPVSAPQSQPAPQPPPQQAQPAAPAQPTPSGRLFAGQYRSAEELERGYESSRAEAKRLYEENLALKAAQLAAERVGRQPRQEPAPQPAAEIPIAFRGDQPVVPIAELRAQLLQEAQEAGTRAAMGVLTPLQQLGSASARLRSTYPEFSQQEGQFGSWLNDNPRYQAIIQNDAEVGLESAYLKYARERGVQATQQATQATHAAQQQIESARQQAAPAGNVAPSSRRPTEQESQWSEFNTLVKQYKETGDPQIKKRLINLRTEMALGEGTIHTLEKTQWGR